MAQYLISDNVLTDIANAIRGKLGTPNTTYKPVNMKTAINSIPVAGTITYEDKTVTPNTSTQQVEASTGKTLRSVTVNPIPSNYVIPTGTTNISTNGTYNVKNYATATVAVSGGGQTNSINIQIAAGGNRVSTTSYSAVSGQTLTVQKTGTYDVYWSGFRSSTSGTNGSQLYIDGTAYGSANTTFTNHGQYIHLTNVSLTKDSVIAVRARARTTSYYMYVSNLTIVEQG